MPYQWSGATLVEPAGHNVFEQANNQALYNVVSGCGLTYSAANMTVNLAAGTITHNGNLVAVAAASNAYTLVSDPSNPRWTWLALTSAGTATMVSGTPAVNPVVPALGDNVGLALVKIEAGQTIAANITYAQNHSVPAPIFARQGSILTAAATLPVVNQNHHVTGGTTITALPNFTAGAVVVLTFDGATPITHNATSLILIAGGSITTAAGDTLIFISEGGGNWRQISTTSSGQSIGSGWFNFA